MNRLWLVLDQWSNSTHYYLLATIYSNISERKNMIIELKSNDDLGKVP